MSANVLGFSLRIKFALTADVSTNSITTDFKSSALFLPKSEIFYTPNEKNLVPSHNFTQLVASMSWVEGPFWGKTLPNN